MAQTKSWALFAKHLGSKLNDDELNDVVFTFGSDGKEQEETIIKANRGLLSILSPVFKSMFKNGMKESLNDDAIPIQDSDSKSFKLFIQYFYGMDPQVTPDNVGALSYLAEKYLVDGLQNICALFLAESMSIQNVIPILEALHAYHQEKLFENCKAWMANETSTEEIINLFKSYAFMNTHYIIANVLLSGFGFGPTVDASILWECVLKWSQTKEKTELCDVECEGGYEDEKENKLDEREEISTSEYEKLVLIRKHFPFYRLPIHIICAKILPLQILTQQMASEVLSHQTHGYERQLSRYCIKHKPLVYPEPSTTIGMEFQNHNLDEYRISSKQRYHTITGPSSRKIFFSSVELTTGKIYEWTIIIDKYTSNSTMSFGMEVVDGNRKSTNKYSGFYGTHSYGLYLDMNSFGFYANNSKQGKGEGGISDGTIIKFRYNGIEGTLNVFANSKQNWTFTGIDTNQTFNLAFNTTDTLTFSVSDIRL